MNEPDIAALSLILTLVIQDFFRVAPAGLQAEEPKIGGHAAAL